MRKGWPPRVRFSRFSPSLIVAQSAPATFVGKLPNDMNRLASLFSSILQYVYVLSSKHFILVSSGAREAPDIFSSIITPSASSDNLASYSKVAGKKSSKSSTHPKVYVLGQYLLTFGICSIPRAILCSEGGRSGGCLLQLLYLAAARIVAAI